MEKKFNVNVNVNILRLFFSQARRLRTRQDFWIVFFEERRLQIFMVGLLGLLEEAGTLSGWGFIDPTLRSL